MKDLSARSITGPPAARPIGPWALLLALLALLLGGGPARAGAGPGAPAQDPENELSAPVHQE